ncbi:MAG: metallophosphoesterase family protein [bacterium]|nr:metallophosphoesterase family protein [bacterium]
MKLGIISDTHGYLNPHIHSIFHGVEAIIHAGDIEGEDILIELQTIAPVTAVRGNMDRFGRLARQDEFIGTSFGGMRFFIVHDIGSPLAVKPRLQRSIECYLPHAIVFGHTHKPYSAYIHNILYFNPGSASQGRSEKKNSVGLITLRNSQCRGEIIFLGN